jgi:hypothetical protein
MTSASSAPAPAGGGLDGGPAPRAAPRGWSIFALFACLFLLAAPDRGPAGDAYDYFVPVMSLVDHGQLAAPPEVRILPKNLLVGVDGGRYTLFPVGQSAAMLPFYALGKLLGPRVGSEALPLVLLNASSALWAALAVLFVWKLLVEAFAVPARRALVCAALYGLATTLLPYSKTLYSEALQSALLAALLYHALAPATPRTLPALGLVFGLLVLTKPIHLVFLPLVLWAAWFNGAFRAGSRRSLLGGVVLAGACAACFFAWNYLRTGNPFDAYGDAPVNLTHNRVSLSFLPQSLLNLFVSPRKNLLVYNPLLALAVAGLFLPMEARRRLFLLGLFVAQLLVFGVFHCGIRQGDWAWGPRYAMVFLPALVPFIAVLLGWIREQPFGQRVVLAAMVAAIGAASLYVQVLGASYDLFGGKLALCGAYEKLRIDGAPECDGDELSASILAVNHYLLWRVTKADIEQGSVPELPWVEERFDPTLAQRIFADRQVRGWVLDRNWLFFGLREKGAEALALWRALLQLVAGLCLLVFWRVSAERPSPTPTPLPST